jgi:ATP-dependent 26S proteasome regulatory subunit
MNNVVQDFPAMALPAGPARPPGAGSALEFLWPSLGRLDQLLDWATHSMHLRRPETAAPFRGLYVSPEDVARGLAQTPGSSPFASDMGALGDEFHGATPPARSPLAELLQRCGLENFDADLILLALAPEIDLRYERIFAYLQDDVTRKRPTVELALNLLCASAEEKLERRLNLSSDATLMREGLIHVISDPNQVEPPFLAHYLKLDEQVLKLLLGDNALDSRLAPFCELVQPAAGWDESALGPETKAALAVLAEQAHANMRPLRFYFQGRSGTGKRQAAEAVAGHLGVPLLSVAADRLLAAPGGSALLKLLFRESQLHRAVLYIPALDRAGSPEGAAKVGPDARVPELLAAVSRHDGITILAGQGPWRPQAGANFGVKALTFSVLGFTESCACWKAELERRGVALETEALHMLASRFRLSSGQIKNAAAAGLINSQWTQAAGASAPKPGHSGDSGVAGQTVAAPLTLDDLSGAARAQCGHDLGRLTAKVQPHYTWDDIILPPDQMAHLHEVCAQAVYRNVVYGEWGFDRKLSLGKGLNMLFVGPPGTGKTMAAEVIAHELQLDLYRIDLSQVVSKYIGESEKNLDRIFTAAENSNAILFFDEADALFGKRSEVRDSHDRYANIEISYLLQKMEEYQGISVLATNLRQNLDDAFMRRVQAVVEFPFPDAEYRQRIWSTVFPREAPLDTDVDFKLLAQEVQLAGGNIKNMALAAAFYAAGDGGSIRMEHLIQAAHREHQKIGRSWNEAGLRQKLINLKHN